MMKSSPTSISRDPVIQARYEEMIAAGESHMMAEMLAFQAAPGLNTDDTFLRGHCNGNQFAKQPHVGDFYKKKAEAAGVDTTGKVYLSSLAQESGDPEAWVSGRGDVKRICAERNWDCEGSVTHHRNADNDEGQRVSKAGDVADDILDREVAKVHPEVAPTPKEKAELREKIRERMRPRREDE